MMPLYQALHSFVLHCFYTQISAHLHVKHFVPKQNVKKKKKKERVGSV